MKKFTQAFTLAEVLITLAIIGVVAALTIPTLVAKINQKVSENRQKTIEARLLDGINRYSVMEDGLSQKYETTYDFLVGLSKHYEMAQICRADEIRNCVTYDKIFYGDENENVNVSSLKTIDRFMGEGKDDYLAPASFITAQGTPVIMAFKKDCAWNTGKAMRSIQDSGCIAYMYDESGRRNPNKLGKDIVAHGLTIVAGGSGVTPFAIVGGVKIMEQPFYVSQGLTKSECEIEKAKNYGISQCIDFFINRGGDRWAYAMKYCHDKGWHLPDETESLAIVKELFKDSSGNHPSGDRWNSDYNMDLYLVWSLGLSSGDSYLWSSVECDSYNAYSRNYSPIGGAPWNGLTRDLADFQVLCIE